MCELPVFKKCCFCIPLRYGLLTWGYLKLILALIFLTLLLILWAIIPIAYRSDLEIVVMFVIILIIEIVINSAFIVGAHKKNVKIFRMYFYYALFMWSVTMMAAVVATGLLSVSLVFRRDSSEEVIIFTVNVVGFTLSIGIQTFLLLALRSEIIKLRSNCPYRFVKDDNEPEGTITPVSQHIDISPIDNTEPINEKILF